MKNIALRKFFFHYELDSSEINDLSYEKNLEKFDEELLLLIEKYGIKFGESITRFLPMKKMSVMYCEQCNHLFMNRDQNPAGFDGDEMFQDDGLEYVILNGGTHDEKNLCEECLPVEHRWGHFS